MTNCLNIVDYDQLLRELRIVEDDCFICVKQKKHSFIVFCSLPLKLTTLALQKTTPEGKITTVTAGEDAGRRGRKTVFLCSRICLGHERFMQHNNYR